MNRFLFFLLVINSIHLLGQNDKIKIQDSLSLEQLIITTTRANDHDPITFQNIGLDQIEKNYLGQDPVILIQEFSPSIVTYSDGGTDIGNYSQLRMRGIDQSRINMSLNGVPLNDMVDHGTYFSNFSDFGNSIQSIQIQRGAGSSHRGTASYGGAINFESPHIFNAYSKAEVQLTVGSFGTLRAAGEISTEVNDNGLGFYGRMTRTETGGYKYNSGSEAYSLFFSGGKISDQHMIKMTAFSGKTQNGQSYLNVPLSIIKDDPRTNFNDINDIDDFEQHMVQLQYAQYASEKITFNATTYYNAAGGVFPFSYGGDQFMFGLENDHYGAMASIENKMSSGTFSAGLHGYIFNRVNFEYITPLVTTPYSRDFTDKVEINAFTKYTYEVENFTFYGSAEIRTVSMNIEGDRKLGSALHSKNRWTFLNWVVGTNYNMNSYSSLYLSLAKTNREPTRSDVLNRVEKSESVVDLELGWKYKVSSLSLNANLFLMTFQNEITSIGALEELSYKEIRQNVDISSRYGLEAVLNYSPTGRVDAALNIAWMDSNIKEYMNGDSRFTNVKHIFTPNWVIQPRVTYNFSELASLKISGRYISESFTELSNNPDFVLPSSIVVNLQVDIPIVKNLNASLMLNNLFDNLYFTEGGPIDTDFDGIVEGMGYRIQPPRNFYLTLKYSI